MRTLVPLLLYLSATCHTLPQKDVEERKDLYSPSSHELTSLPFVLRARPNYTSEGQCRSLRCLLPWCWLPCIMRSFGAGGGGAYTDPNDLHNASLLATEHDAPGTPPPSASDALAAIQAHCKTETCKTDAACREACHDPVKKLKADYADLCTVPEPANQQACAKLEHLFQNLEAMLPAKQAGEGPKFASRPQPPPNSYTLCAACHSDKSCTEQCTLLLRRWEVEYRQQPGIQDPGSGSEALHPTAPESWSELCARRWCGKSPSCAELCGRVLPPSERRGEAGE